MLKEENNQYILEKTKNAPIAQLVEQLTFNQWVTGSNPVRLTTKINDLAEIIHKPVKPRVPNGFQNRAPHLQRARARERPVSFCMKGVKLLKAQD